MQPLLIEISSAFHLRFRSFYEFLCILDVYETVQQIPVTSICGDRVMQFLRELGL